MSQSIASANVATSRRSLPRSTAAPSPITSLSAVADRGEAAIFGERKKLGWIVLVVSVPWCSRVTSTLGSTPSRARLRMHAIALAAAVQLFQVLLELVLQRRRNSASSNCAAVISGKNISARNTFAS